MIPNPIRRCIALLASARWRVIRVSALAALMGAMLPVIALAQPAPAPQAAQIPPAATPAPTSQAAMQDAPKPPSSSEREPGLFSANVNYYQVFSRVPPSQRMRQVADQRQTRLSGPTGVQLMSQYHNELNPKQLAPAGHGALVTSGTAATTSTTTVKPRPSLTPKATPLFSAPDFWGVRTTQKQVPPNAPTPANSEPKP